MDDKKQQIKSNPSKKWLSGQVITRLWVQLAAESDWLLFHFSVYGIDLPGQPVIF
ncbi:MAG: hypothetical protein PVG96_03955 [Desulfobacterales bacterium]|jgi:hypothetical protein